MSMNRRDFLKAATAAGCMAPFAGVSHLAYGATVQNAPMLLVVFMRGGADGLHMLGPSADPLYVAARPQEMRVSDGEGGGHRLDRSLDAAAGFALHAEAAPLFELYQAGRLAAIHAVGITDGTRSHFVAQDLIERGLSDEKRLTNVNSGWLARALGGVGGLVPAYSATASPAYALHGNETLLSTADIAGGLGVPWGAPTSQLLHGLAGGNSTPAHTATLAALNVLEAVDRQLPREGNGRVKPYQSSGKTTYEGGELSRSLASVARLAKMDVGLRAACVDHGGWDTHEGQGNRFANQMRQLSQALAAFHDDMTTAKRPFMAVVMTEFGRRLRANKSGGTDHGHGACWLVLGDRVKGGRMYGKWPGLDTPHLDQGVDLAVTTDYRNVLAEASNACRLLPRQAFPEWQAGVPLGFAG